MCISIYYMSGTVVGTTHKMWTRQGVSVFMYTTKQNILGGHICPIDSRFTASLDKACLVPPSLAADSTLLSVGHEEEGADGGEEWL